MNSIGFFPGCSLLGGGIELMMSIRAIAEVAGVELREVADWNCCGASAAHSLDHYLGAALPYRVLCLAEEQGLSEVVAPCAACFSRLKGTIVRLERGGDLPGKMRQITGREFTGGVQILNINEFINRMLDDGLADKLPRRFDGMKVAPYYGCLLARGKDIVTDDAESPTGMDAAIRAAGCEPVAWNFAAECCGGGFSMSMTDAVVRLSHEILSDARIAGAQAIVTGCPMCHSNLDLRQKNINAAGFGPHDMPVLYLSELLGLVAGLDPRVLGLDRHFTDAMRVTQLVTDRQVASSGGGTERSA
jgi:heterodisulfide reductase subunit B2